MKKQNNKNFFNISTLLIAVVMLLSASIAWSANLGNIHRWAWNAIIDTNTNPNPTGFGWLSANCRNDFDNNGVLDDRCKSPNNTDITYGLTVNLDGNNNTTTLSSFSNAAPDYLQGCAWSATFGWVCFDQDAAYCPVSNAACAKLSPDGVEIEADTTYPFHYLKSSLMNDINSTADARAVALNLVGTNSEARGYVGFPFDPASGFDPNVGNLPSQPPLTGNVTSCFGCKTALNNGSDQCDVCYLVNDGLNDPSIAPNPNIMCTQCGSCNATVRGGSCGNSSNTCAVSSCQKCYTKPGVVVNYYGVCQNNGIFCIGDGNCGSGGKCTYQNASAELCGWGFNAATSDINNASIKPTGLGWVAFNPTVYGKATPYVNVKNGSVFSGGDITQPLSPPTGRSNATYLIDAKGTVTRWTSSSSPAYVRQNLGNAVPNFLTYDQTSGQAISSIGSVDIQGLITEAVNASETNKYGSHIDFTSGDRMQDEINAGIDGRVLVVNGSSTINAPISIKAGHGSVPGSGVIYINGNLTITKNVSYDTVSATISRLKYIPSLVWIVRGDVTIDPSVDTVDGTFIVLGDGSPATCPAIITTSNPPASQGCGRFSTGNDKTLASPRSLTVHGHVLAKQFLFQRSYSAPDSKNRAQPAEIFIADGRIQANPPTGMSELSRSLPKFNFSF
jgi:hypothetical protein